MSESTDADEKSSERKPSTLERIIRSPPPSESSGWRKSQLSRRSAITSGESRPSVSAGRSVTSLTSTRVAPCARATATGMLAERPPSVRVRSPIRSGVKTSGIAMEARTACARSPSRMVTTLRSRRSVATMRSGIGKRSKSPRAIRLPRNMLLFSTAFTSCWRTAELCREKPASPASQSTSGRRPPQAAGPRNSLESKRSPEARPREMESISWAL